MSSSPNAPPICNIVIITVKDPNDVREIRALLSQQRRLSLAEPGCLKFEVYHSRSDERVFILHEWWESEKALEVHRSAKAYLEVYKPKVLPRVERTPHPSTLVE